MVFTLFFAGPSTHFSQAYCFEHHSICMIRVSDCVMAVAVTLTATVPAASRFFSKTACQLFGSSCGAGLSEGRARQSRG